MLAILVPFIPLQGGVAPLFAMAMLAGCSSMAVGLLVSTLARTELQAIQLVPLVILPQVMLSGILLPVAGEKASTMARWLSAPVLMRWGYAGALHVELASVTQRGEIAQDPVFGGRYWKRVGFGEPGTETLFSGPLVSEVMVLAGLGAGAVALTWVLLALRDRR